MTTTTESSNRPGTGADRVVPVDLQLGELADSLLGDLDRRGRERSWGESNTVGMLDSGSRRTRSLLEWRAPGARSLEGVRDSTAE